MCWTTVDRALAISHAFLERDRPEWIELRDAIAADVLEHGWKPQVGAFTGTYEDDDLDAAVLCIGLVGLLDPRDERFLETVDAVDRHLREGPTVYPLPHRRRPARHGRRIPPVHRLAHPILSRGRKGTGSARALPVGCLPRGADGPVLRAVRSDRAEGPREPPSMLFPPGAPRLRARADSPREDSDLIVTGGRRVADGIDTVIRSLDATGATTMSTTPGLALLAVLLLVTPVRGAASARRRLRGQADKPAAGPRRPTGAGIAGALRALLPDQLRALPTGAGAPPVRHGRRRQRRMRARRSRRERRRARRDPGRYRQVGRRQPLLPGRREPGHGERRVEPADQRWPFGRVVLGRPVARARVGHRVQRPPQRARGHGLGRAHGLRPRHPGRQRGVEVRHVSRRRLGLGVFDERDLRRHRKTACRSTRSASAPSGTP